MKNSERGEVMMFQKFDGEVPMTIYLGSGNRFVSFKHRRIDLRKPVKIYRNLHGSGDRRYSIQQAGLVVGHTDQIALTNVKFKVNEAARQKVLATRRKNVHAFVIGHVAVRGISAEINLPIKISYNPYKAPTFRGSVPALAHNWPVFGAGYLVINASGISASYANTQPKPL